MKRQSSRSSARKKVDRTVTKKCPKCTQECPVARKSCTCGYQFPTRTRNVQSKALSEAATKAEDPELIETKRRRFRTKRMRPDFFNPLDVEYSSRRRSRSTSEVKRKRGRPKGSINKPKPEPEPKPTPPPEDDNLFGNVPPEKMLHFQ
ncbi:hypothetical protein C0Q70_05887 [Pomacea canaliculata]|uniref:Uncharacterized protein n=1 Tax=Pomacea canaliculata TaxID=400727 RepID=A0A2T7PMG5_POMCA|nr:UPF0547 protein C16orf87 homolog [Pomacea canaliculata]PVD34611.1 hypothetical protein C0Q70_05887 [Pomacea canaliculata]